MKCPHETPLTVGKNETGGHVVWCPVCGGIAVETTVTKGLEVELKTSAWTLPTKTVSGETE
jgi:hypothetical protein